MWSLLRSVLRLFVAARPAQAASQDPDLMSLRDWADLPPHHPRNDRAPC
jgi:hypothetical protein